MARIISFKKLLFFNLCLFVVFQGCKNGKSFYDENGRLIKEISYLKSDSLLEKSFHTNGQLMEKGVYLDTLKVGIWEEWYSDGAVKWQGTYSLNERVIDSYQQTPLIKFENESRVFKTDTFYRFRLYVDGLHPDDISLSVNNGAELIKHKKGDDFNFSIAFRNERLTILKVYAYYLEDDYYIGEVAISSKNIQSQR